MQDAKPTEIRIRRVRSHREETREIEVVAGELKVWRDREADQIVIEPSAFALAKKPGGRITLSARDARHLANSLLLFAEEIE